MRIPKPSTTKKYITLEIMVLVEFDQGMVAMEDDISRAINETEHPSYSLIQVESILDYEFYEECK